MNTKKTDYSIYLIGGLIGAFIGILAAFLVDKSSEFEGSGHQLTGKKLSKLGLGTISILWQLIDQGKGFQK